MCEVAWNDVINALGMAEGGRATKVKALFSAVDLIAVFQNICLSAYRGSKGTRKACADRTLA